jgi:hypothetical protein
MDKNCVMPLVGGINGDTMQNFGRDFSYLAEFFSCCGNWIEVFLICEFVQELDHLASIKSIPVAR